MLIQFTCTQNLLTALERYHGIKPEDYKPAYNGESVGLDLYNASTNHILMLPGSKFLIPTGLKVALPLGYGAFIYQRGSIIKTPLIHRAGVVDPGWTKEIFVPVFNISKDPLEDYKLEPYQKLPFQLVVHKCETQFAFIDSDTYDETTKHSIRGERGFGSTG